MRSGYTGSADARSSANVYGFFDGGYHSRLARMLWSNKWRSRMLKPKASTALMGLDIEEMHIRPNNAC